MEEDEAFLEEELGELDDEALPLFSTLSSTLTPAAHRATQRDRRGWHASSHVSAARRERRMAWLSVSVVSQSLKRSLKDTSSSTAKRAEL